MLFFAEPATLAHVVRPVALARAMPADRFGVTVATGADYRAFVARERLAVRALDTIGTRAYLEAVRAGRPVFPYAVLERYVRDDLRHMEECRPDVVVGDFRLSLAVSARIAGIPYVSISNAYWSPCTRARHPIPVHPLTRVLGPAIANAMFQVARPAVYVQHCLPMHRLRRRYGLPSLGFDLRRVFTEADLTAFADVPALVPDADCGRPQRYRYIGPVLWSPEAAMPQAMQEDATGAPLVYLTMGSSGDPRVVPRLAEALASAGVRLAVATAGAVPRAALPPNVIAADYLPGDELAARARFVVCNGGSPAVYQALAHGTPVLGIPGNLDQLLNMHFVERSGAGIAIRADRVASGRIRDAAHRLLEDASFAAAARHMSEALAQYSAPKIFAELVAGIASARSPPGAG